MLTSEVLNLAADLIEERGWTTGGGWSPTPRGVCLEGGILAALGLEWGVADLGEFWSCSAYTAVQSYLGLSEARTLHPGHRVPSPDEALWAWNDTRGRTASEVIEVLRATAVIEAAKEEAAERESVKA